jgi:hypothetical protein
MEIGRRDQAPVPPPGRRDESNVRDLWDELVLPDREMEALRWALAELAAQRRTGSSSAPDGSGAKPLRLTLLFAGGPGTGKTMATQLLAGDLDVQTVRLDLLDIFSQDRAAAERQIDGAFAQAERAGALLVFEHADSLLTEGPPVQHQERISPHEDGPPLELSELVDRSHEHPGVVVFVSEITPKVAPSLADGMDFEVEFPFPWSDARKEIWRRLLPRDAQVSEDDLDYLAVSFPDPGATIRDCCVEAMTAAAEEGVPVTMLHIGRALESGYRRRLVSARASQPLARLLDQDSEQPDQADAADTAEAVDAPDAPEAADQPTADAPDARTDPAPTPLPPEAPAVEEPSDDSAMSPADAMQARIEAALGHRKPAPEQPKAGATPAAFGFATAKPVFVTSHSAPPLPTPPPDTAVIEERASERHPPRPSAARGVAVLAIAAILLAAALGFGFARLLGGGSSKAANKAASAGPVQLSFPSDWVIQDVPAAQARGLTDPLGVGPPSAGHGLLVVGTSEGQNGSLLARPLRAALSHGSPANVVTLGALNFNVYPNVSEGAGSNASLYALPTTAGTVFGICVTSGAPAGFTHSCERVLASVRLSSGRVVPPGQSASYASAVNQTIRTLNAARAKAGSQLRLAKTVQAQAAAATELAAAHTAAASTLSKLAAAGPATAANSALVAALRASASAYTALAEAAAQGDPVAYSAKSGAVTRAESSLRSALSRLESLGYQVG